MVDEEDGLFDTADEAIEAAVERVLNALNETSGECVLFGPVAMSSPREIGFVMIVGQAFGNVLSGVMGGSEPTEGIGPAFRKIRALRQRVAAMVKNRREAKGQRTFVHLMTDMTMLITGAAVLWPEAHFAKMLQAAQEAAEKMFPTPDDPADDEPRSGSSSDAVH